MPPMRPHRHHLAAAMLVLVLAGCSVVEHTAKLPFRTVEAVIPASRSSQAIDPAALQAQLLRYADDFSSRTGLGIDDYARSVNTPQASLEALQWKIAINSSVLGIATGGSPTANLIDFLALSSLTRAFLEQSAREASPPGAFDPWLNESRGLETNAWKLAERVLSPAHQAEFRAAIDQWLASHPGIRTGFFRRPQDLASGIRQSGTERSKPGSVFSLVGLDPMAGLDPAVREVTRTRLFAERALYAMERMPFVIRWQTELLAQQVLSQENLTNAISSADRLSRAAESVSVTAAQIPDRFTAERQAILNALETQEGKLRALSAEITRTLDAGEKMSTSLNTTIATFDALMKRFGVGEPDTSPPSTNSRPFDIREYAQAADRITLMAAQLEELLKSADTVTDTPALEKRVAELSALSARAKADARSVLNYAFLLAAALILLTFACALAFRRLAPSRGPANPALPPPRTRETSL